MICRYKWSMCAVNWRDRTLLKHHATHLMQHFLYHRHGTNIRVLGMWTRTHSMDLCLVLSCKITSSPGCDNYWKWLKSTEKVPKTYQKLPKTNHNLNPNPNHNNKPLILNHMKPVRVCVSFRYFLTVLTNGNYHNWAVASLSRPVMLMGVDKMRECRNAGVKDWICVKCGSRKCGNTLREYV